MKTIVKNYREFSNISVSTQISATSLHYHIEKSRRKNNTTQIFATNMADINKTLVTKIYQDSCEKLSRQYHVYLDLFDKKKASKLPSLYDDGIDHKIKLENKSATIPGRPLYSISCNKLLVLRKILTELLNKGFIQVSNSSAATSVLFIKKPEKDLRFYVDYCNLNKIMKKDRYLLPLIYKILRNISQVKGFIKLNIMIVFYRIGIAEDDKWKIAFCI